MYKTTATIKKVLTLAVEYTVYQNEVNATATFSGVDFTDEFWDEIDAAAYADWEARKEHCEHKSKSELYCGLCHGSGEAILEGYICFRCNGKGVIGEVCDECEVEV